MNDMKMPTIGAALRVDQLNDYRDWLIDGQRDVEIQDAISPALLERDWQPLVQKVQAVLAGHNGRLGIHGPFLDFSLATRDPAIREVVVRRLTQGLHFAADLGATHMVMHSPFMPFGAPETPYAATSTLDDMLKRTAVTLETIIPLAEKIGCTLVIETIKDKSPTPLLTLIQHLNSPHVRLSLDVGHCYINHLQGGPSPDTWAEIGKDLLAHLHIQDTDGLADRHWAPGDGNINWHALFQALNQMPHQPRLLLETKFVQRGFNWLVEQGHCQ